jgi:hypothetical protein
MPAAVALRARSLLFGQSNADDLDILDDKWPERQIKASTSPACSKFSVASVLLTKSKRLKA